jgi:peptidoglycan/xylan/chitin deacetylase (PgdA/CDA1 family)
MSRNHCVRGIVNLCLEPRPSVAVLVCASLLAAACTTTKSEEHVGTSAQPLSASQFFGTSLPDKTLALTFDDGPGEFATYDGQDGEGTGISQYLNSLGIRAVFFQIGGHVGTTTLPNPLGISVTPHAAEILAQIVSDGHLIGNHTMTHRDLVAQVLPLGATQVVDEIAQTDAILSGYIPSGWLLFRAPYTSYSTGVWSAVEGTSVDNYIGPISADIGDVNTNYPSQASDWACWQGQETTASGQPAGAAGNGYLTTEECGNAYLAEIASVGHGIILMHEPFSWAQGNTLAMVKYIVPILIADGYSFVRADDVPDIRAALPPCDASCASCSGTGPGQCTGCSAGSFLHGGSCNACTVCSGTTFQATACTATSDAQCSACDASCATCSGPGSGDCTTCADGSYLDGGHCVACSACAAGSYEAQPCSAGNPATCVPCQAGTFAPSDGCMSCTPCAAGTYSATSGATSCSPCPAGSIAATAGQSTCTACGPGTSASGEGQTACTTCGGGNYSDAGAATCSACTAGTYAGPDAGACAPCPSGTFSAAGAVSCTACAGGTFAGPGAGSCSACAAGTAAMGAGSAVCTPCAAGTYAPSGSAGCSACPSGSYALAGAASCTDCGSCADGDPCTRDTCDPTTGCVHTPLQGCVADAGTQRADTGTEGADADTQGSGAHTPSSDAGRPADAARTRVVSVDATAPRDAVTGGGPDPDAGSSGGCAMVGTRRDGGLAGGVLGFALVVALGRRRRAS